MILYMMHLKSFSGLSMNIRGDLFNKPHLTLSTKGICTFYFYYIFVELSRHMNFLFKELGHTQSMFA